MKMQILLAGASGGGGERGREAERGGGKDRWQVKKGRDMPEQKDMFGMLRSYGL